MTWPLFQWWLQPDQYPDAARLHDPVVIQTQEIDRRTSRGCQPTDRHKVVPPGKVVVPLLLAGVKQRNDLAIVRIRSVLSWPLELIAAIAGQTEVFRGRGPARDERNDMLDDHWDAHDHGAAAVGAALSIPFRNPPSQCGRDPGTPRHELWRSRNGVAAPLQQRQGI